MNAKQAVAWVKKCGIAVESVGASEGERDIPSLASDSPFSRRFSLPTGRRKNYLHPSASLACPRQIGRPVFQAPACRCQRSAHVCGQAQTAGHSISQVGAERSPKRRAQAHRERGRFTIGVPSITIAFKLRDQYFAKLYKCPHLLAFDCSGEAGCCFYC